MRVAQVAVAHGFGNNVTGVLIEKAYRRSPELDAEELLFEFAMCVECLYTVEASFSEESRQHIERFYAERVDLDRRAATLLNRDHVDVSDWIGTCMVNSTPVEELTNISSSRAVSEVHLH